MAGLFHLGSRMADLDITGRVVVDASQAEGAFDRVADKAEQMGREVADAARQAGKEVDGMGDGANTSAEKFTRAEARIRDSIKRSTQELNLLGKTASEKLEFKIADKGLDSSKFTSYIAELKKAEAAQMALGAASVRSGSVASASLDSMGMSAKATAAALRGVPAQFTDIITSLQGGQAPLTVFLQQGGQLKDMFGGAGNAAKALGGFVMGLITPFTLAAGTVAAVAFAYREGSKEADAYNKAVITTGNASGTTAAQMQQMAQRIGSVVGTQGAAADALAKMAGSSRIAAENFEYFGAVALKVEKTVGTSVAETVKQFAELGKSPVDASKKLNEETNYLTQSIYEQIKALKDQGREADAASVAQNAYADALNSRSDQMTQNLGLIEKAWRGIAGAAKAGWDAMLNVGRSDSMSDQINNVRQQIAQAQGQDKNRPFSLPWDTPLADLQQRLSYLTEEERLMKRGAESQAARAQAEKEAIEATDALGKANEKALTKQEQMNKALGEYRANLEKVKAVNPNSALLDPAQVAKSEKAIREQFTERTAAVRKGNDELQKQQDLIAKLSGLDPSFSRDWEILSQAYKSGVLSLDELVKKQAELLAKQPAMTAQIKAQAEAEKERAKTAEELTKTMEAYAKAQQAGVSSAIDAATQAETQLAQYGLLKSEVQELTLAYLEQSRESAALAGEDVSNIDKRIAAQKRLIAATRGLEAREISDTAAKDAAKEWERAAEKINDTLTDALMRGFESGKDFAKNLRDTVVNMFKTMVLRPVISAVLSPVSMALSGLTGAGSAAAGQAGGSALGSAGGSLMGSALGGIGAFGTGASYGAASLFANGLTGTLAAGGQMIGAGSVMSGLGTIAGALGPIAIGIALLSSLIKKSTPHTGAASTYSEAGGLVSGEHLWGTDGFKGSADYNAGVEQVTGNVAKAIGDTLNSTAKAFGKTAGYEISTAFADDSSKDGAWGSLIIKQMGEAVLDWRDTQTSRWAPKEFADGEAGSKEYLAEVAKSARDALVGAIGDVDWATDMLTALGDSPTLEGLAQTVAQINAAQAAFDALGKNIVGFGALTDGAISQLVKAAGSIDGLVSAASAYYDNFYSEAEKTANVTRDVAAALADVGLQMPTTRDDFRALVESQMALGESGASAVAALLGVSGAFASVTEAAIDTAAAAQKAAADTAAAAEKAAEEARRRAEQIAQEKFGLESKLMQLLGDTAGLRAREIDALDASNRALQEHIYALQDAKAAEEAAKGAIETAYSSLERAVSAEKDAINKQLQAQQDGYQAQIDAAQSAADSIKSIASALASAVKSTQIDADSFDFQRLKNARSTISSAAGSGNLQYAGLENALGVAGQDSKKFYGRFEDYAFEQGVLAGNIGKLNNQAQGQLTTAEKTLQQLKDQMRISGEQSRAQLAALDAQLVEQRNLADVALGIDNSVLSVKAAVDGLQAAIAGLAAAQAASAIAKAQVSSSGGGGGGYGGYSGGGTAYEGATYTDFMGNQVALQAGQSRQFLDAVAAAGTAAVGSLSELRDRLQAVGKSDIWEALSKDLTLNYQDFDQTYGRGVPTISASDGVISAGGYRPDNQSMQDYAANISAWAQANGVQGATNNGYSQSDISNAINTTLGQGASIADIINAGAANFGLTEQEIRDAARAAGIPGFASGGYFGGGLRIVGENGPELEATGPARIWNAADTANMLGGGNGEMVAELRALRAEVAELKASNNAIAGHTAATHRQLVRIAPNDKVQTEVAA